MKNAVSYLLIFWNAVDLRYRNLNNPKVRLNIAGIVLMEVIIEIKIFYYTTIIFHDGFSLFFYYFYLKGPLAYSNSYLEKNEEKSYILNLLLPQTGFYFIHRWAAANEAYFDMVLLTTE